MNIESFAHQDGRFVRTYEYDDGVTLAADLGVASGDASVDIVDGTAIVVVGSDDEQFEIDLPTGQARAFIKNGVLTIEMEADNE